MAPRLPAATAALAALAGGWAAGAQPAASVALEGVDGTAAFNALAQECYEAGLVSSMVSDSILECSGVIEERRIGGEDDAEPDIVVRHELRFTLIERGGGARVTADAWTETDELGTTIEEPFTSEEYWQRVQGVLTAVAARLHAAGAPPWVGRYETEQAWHLDAHLRAVSHCDANLGSMTAASVGAELASIGLRPTGDDTRDRCEQLYTHVFEWGLARGDAQPTVATYSRYRASLPPEQRTCSGQLAREATCRR